MRQQVEESVATGVAAGRGRGGRFSAGRKREVVMRLLRGEDDGDWWPQRPAALWPGGGSTPSASGGPGERLKEHVYGLTISGSQVNWRELPWE